MSLVRPNLIWTVALQELRATWRDRRTMTSTIFVPLLVIPLITVGLPMLISGLTQGQRQQMQTVGVVGTLPPALRAELEHPTSGKSTAQGVRLITVTDAQAAIQSGKADAVLVVRRPLPTQAGAGKGEAELVYKVGNLKAESGAAQKVSRALERYNRQLVTQKLSQLGLNADLLTPVSVKTVDASSNAESSSGALAFIIPLFLLQFILAGATAAATDAAAGERERGTLEALLSTPAPRSALLLGKLLSTTFTALIAACCSVLGLTLSAPIALLLMPKGNAAQMSATQQAFGGSLQLGLPGLGALLLIVASSALLISALLLMLSLFARTVREAQTLIAPLSLLIVLPATLLQFADFLHASPLLYALPLVGGMLSILDTVKGTLTTPHLLLSLGGNLLLAALLGWVGTRLFGTERVSFKE